jgi:hypothetical protein
VSMPSRVAGGKLRPNVRPPGRAQAGAAPTSRSSANNLLGFLPSWLLRGRSLFSAAMVPRWFGSLVTVTPLAQSTQSAKRVDRGALRRKHLTASARPRRSTWRVPAESSQTPLEHAGSVLGGEGVDVWGACGRGVTVDRDGGKGLVRVAIVTPCSVSTAQIDSTPYT